MILAIDVGTSSARASLYDTGGRGVADRFHQVQLVARTTADGGVEHDAARVVDAVVACVDAACRGARPGELAAVGVTTFWHGLLGFDTSGRPVTPVYLWADTRSASDAALLRGALDEEALHARTGCRAHSSYWPAKLRWLARARPDEMRRVARWGSIGEALELAIFGEAATSVSMASATGLFDQAGMGWDVEAMAAAGIEPRHLFPVCDRDTARRGLRAPWAKRWPALRGVPWFPAVGDGAAGNVGSGCVDPARVALNVGTSAALRVATATPAPPPPELWRYRLDRRLSLLGGATSEGGNVYAWCRDTLNLPGEAALDAALAGVEPDGHRLTVLPFLAGERAPGWRGNRRGAIAGLSLDTTPIAILRAALEAVALRLALVYEVLAPHAAPDHTIVASGGALARSRAWREIVADALGRPITWLTEREATSRGAARLALHALGALPDLAEAPPPGEIVAPDPAHHARYRDALERQRRLDERV